MRNANISIMKANQHLACHNKRLMQKPDIEDIESLLTRLLQNADYDVSATEKGRA